MKRTTALILCLLMCLSAVVFAVPASAEDLGKNLLLDASYQYLEYNSFLGSCSDTACTLLNDGKVRGEDVEFDDMYGVPGTTVEVAGTYDETIIEFTLKDPSFVNCLVFRGVRRNGNRYLNIASIQVAEETGAYSAVSFDESSVIIEGAPYAPGTTDDQYFDVTATFDETAIDVKKIKVELNTYAPSGNKYVVSFDELEAYGFSTGSYKPGATVAISGNTAVATGSTFTVNAYVNSITVPNGLVGIDFPLVYDTAKLQLVSAEPIVPANWAGKYVDLSPVDKNGSPCWLSVACAADDLLTDSDYYVKNDNALGFAITFKAISAGDAIITIDNDLVNETFVLAVDAVGFVNYGATGASHTVAVSGDALTTYTVSYDANGGSGAPTAQTKIEGDALTLSSLIPTKEGSAFKGWATSANATVAEYAAGAVYNTDADLKLYAVWEAVTDEYLVGDVNCDGWVDNLDAAYVLKHDAELIQLDAKELLIGDVNKDGNVDSLDAAQILKYDAMLIEDGFGTIKL